MEDISINFETRVSSYLNFLISVKETRTYSEIADKCDIKPPGKIRKISRILLKITENDIIDKKIDDVNKKKEMYEIIKSKY